MKIVCILNQNIFLVNNGGSQCASRNYRALEQAVGEDNIYTCIVMPGMTYESTEHRLVIPGIDSNLKSVCNALVGCKCYNHHYEKEILEFIRRVAPDMVYIDTSKMGRLARIIKKKMNIPTAVFMHNVESDYSMNMVKNRGIHYLPAYFASLYNERCEMKYTDSIICLTDRDSRRIACRYGRSADYIVPISFEDRFDKSRMDIMKGRNLLFVGSLFAPNYNGIKWFIDYVMPLLEDTTLTIVGRDFETKADELIADNVMVQGSVLDPAEYYYRYPVVVMPIQYGDGMKVKTAEAMMYGKIIVASPEALEGYDTDNCDGIYKCIGPEEYRDAIQEIFSKEDYTHTKEEVRNRYLAKYDSCVVADALKKMINDTINKL